MFLERKQQNSVLFSKIGDNIEDFINPNEFFYIQLYLDNPMHIKFNISISKNSNIGLKSKFSCFFFIFFYILFKGIYGEKNVAPTFTRFKFFETFSGVTLVSSTNSLSSSLKVSAYKKILNSTTKNI